MNTCQTNDCFKIKFLEKIAENIFRSLPEDGPIVAIMDRCGNIWANDQQQFANLNIDKDVLNITLKNVDDGLEPASFRRDNTTIFLWQLRTERTNFGYILMAVSHLNSDNFEKSAPMIDIFFNQTELIAQLIEDADICQNRPLNMYRCSEMPTVLAN